MGYPRIFPGSCVQRKRWLLVQDRFFLSWDGSVMWHVNVNNRKNVMSSTLRKQRSSSDSDHRRAAAVSLHTKVRFESAD